MRMTKKRKGQKLEWQHLLDKVVLIQLSLSHNPFNKHMIHEIIVTLCKIEYELVCCILQTEPEAVPCVWLFALDRSPSHLPKSPR